MMRIAAYNEYLAGPLSSGKLVTVEVSNKIDHLHYSSLVDELVPYDKTQNG